MEIYGEYFFIENLIADGVIAALTLKLWRRKIFSVNYVIAVFLMTMYSFFIFCSCSTIVYSFPVKLVFSLIIVKILFFRSDLKLYFQTCITFFGVGMVMGGAVSFTIYMLKIGGMSSSGIVYVNPGSYPLILVSIAASYIFIRIFFYFLSERKKKENMFVDLNIRVGNGICNLKAIVDTGNFLRDPVDNLPVLLVEADIVRPMLKENLRNAKIRIIPYTSVGQETGTLMGVKTDCIVIKDGNTEYEGVPGVMAVYNGNFGLENGCNAILHPEILKREAVKYAD